MQVSNFTDLAILKKKCIHVVEMYILKQCILIKSCPKVILILERTISITKYILFCNTTEKNYETSVLNKPYIQLANNILSPQYWIILFTGMALVFRKQNSQP